MAVGTRVSALEGVDGTEKLSVLVLFIWIKLKLSPVIDAPNRELTARVPARGPKELS
jgi:hypothetical protein